MKNYCYWLLFLLFGAVSWSQDILPLAQYVTLDYGKSDNVFLRNLPQDWSQYQAIAFTVKANKASEITPSMIFSSEDPQQPGMDYFIVGIPLRGTTEYHVVWPLAELAKTRHPVGWHKIDWVEIHADWSGQKRHDKSIILTIRDLRLLKGDFKDNTKGPRIDDEEFFNLLDYSRKELADVQKAVTAKNYPAAKHALAEHIRTRREPLWSANAADRPTKGQPPVTARRVRGEEGRYVFPNMPLSSADWRKVELQLSDVKPLGKPQGFSLISGLQLRWNAPASMSADAAIHLDDIEIIYKDGSKRMLGDFESFVAKWSILQRDTAMRHDGNASGKWQFSRLFSTAACQACPVDWSKAEKLSFWLKASDGVMGELSVQLLSAAPDTAEADSILSHHFSLQGFRKAVHDFGPRIDWSCNPMDKGETKTVEWNAKLNRCFHFAPLINAYWQTGDDKYARELAEEMNGWIEDNPVLLFRSGNGPYHYAWETLNTGIRMHNTWPEALFRCLDSPSFTDDIIVNIMKSTVEHVRHLQQWPSKGNWLTAESYGVYVAGMMFPEFKDAKAWRLYAIEKLHRQLFEEVYPDGVQFELALGYNTWTLNEFLGAYEKALLNGMEGEFPQDYRNLLEKMYAYLMKISMPDGQAFAMNDAGNQNVRALLIKGYQLFPHRDDFIHAALGGTKGFRKPERDSFGMHWAGHYVMRSGWTEQGNVLLMDAGPWGKGHQHEDKLTLSLYANGMLLLPDGGCTMYDHSRWRAYQLLTRAHNSVLIDGMDQFNGRKNYYWPLPWKGNKPAETDSRWFSTPNLDYAEGVYSGDYREYTDFDLMAKGIHPNILQGITHRRGVLFIKPDIWLVHDMVKAKDEANHTMEAIYHIHAEKAVADAENATVTASTPKKAGLYLATIASSSISTDIVTGKMEPPVQGWSANIRENRPADIPMSPVPTTIFKSSWKNRGDMVTVLRPFKDGENKTPKIQKILAQEELGVCRLTLADNLEYLVLRHEKEGMTTKTDELATDAEIAVVALKHDSEHLVLGIINGAFLKTETISVELSQKTSFSLNALSANVFIAATADDARVCLTIPDIEKYEIHELDRYGKRRKIIETKKEDNGKVFLDLKGDTEYELTTGQGASAFEIREKLTKADKPSLDFQVKPLPPCGKAPNGTEVVVQAENPTAEGGGSIVVSDKVGADGRAFLHWDWPGHWLEYAFDVPTDGAYELQLKYCIGETPVFRALLVDGFLPAEALRSLVFAETGGWSSTRDDWRWQSVTADGKSPFRFNLTKGRHVFRFVNLENSMNMDVLTLKALP